MSADWQAGDKAVCIALEHPMFTGRSTTLELGAIYTVRRAGWSKSHPVIFGIALKEVRPRKYRNGGYPADLFRKIRPDEHEPCEEEFVTLLKRTKRTVTA